MKVEYFQPIVRLRWINISIVIKAAKNQLKVLRLGALQFYEKSFRAENVSHSNPDLNEAFGNLVNWRAVCKIEELL